MNSSEQNADRIAALVSRAAALDEKERQRKLLVAQQQEAEDNLSAKLVEQLGRLKEVKSGAFAISVTQTHRTAISVHCASGICLAQFTVGTADGAPVIFSGGDRFLKAEDAVAKAIGALEDAISRAEVRGN